MVIVMPIHCDFVGFCLSRIKRAFCRWCHQGITKLKTCLGRVVSAQVCSHNHSEFIRLNSFELVGESRYPRVVKVKLFRLQMLLLYLYLELLRQPLRFNCGHASSWLRILHAAASDTNTKLDRDITCMQRCRKSAEGQQQQCPQQVHISKCTERFL